jgi:hypothetical protein
MQYQEDQEEREDMVSPNDVGDNKETPLLQDPESQAQLAKRFKGMSFRRKKVEMDSIYNVVHPKV